MLHNHIDVLGSETLLGERCRVVDSLLVLLLDGGFGLTSRLLGEFLGLCLAETGVGILKSELTEDGERLSIIVALENLGLIDNENETVSLSEGNTSNAGELFHSELEKGFSALLLTSVQVLGITLVLKSGHFLLLVIVTAVFVVNVIGHLKVVNTLFIN